MIKDSVQPECNQRGDERYNNRCEDAFQKEFPISCQFIFREVAALMCCFDADIGITFFDNLNVRISRIRQVVDTSPQILILNPIFQVKR